MGGYIYAFSVEGSSLIKIGYSADPEHRLKMIQSMLPFKMSIVYQLWVEKPGTVESWAHYLLCGKKKCSEWFDVDPGMIPSIFKEAEARSISQLIDSGIYKMCTKCRDILHISNFYKNRYAKNNMTSHCRDCLKKRDNKRKESIMQNNPNP